MPVIPELQRLRQKDYSNEKRKRRNNEITHAEMYRLP
jgi:hypothetical protein